MKYSFWTLAATQWSNAEAAAAAQRFGYQGVDLRCTSGGNVSLDSTDAEIETVKETYAGRGIEIASLLAYNKRGNREGVDWPAVTEDLIANAHIAERLGAQAVRVNAGSPATGEDWHSYLEGFARALESALRQVPAVQFYVQNHPGSLTAAQCGQLASMVNKPRFAVGLSPDHCVDQGEDVLAVTHQIASQVGQVYLADRVRLGDGGLKACLPGEGFVPNREVLSELKGQGFDGWVSFKWEKPTYPDLPDAGIALPHFVNFMTT